MTAAAQVGGRYGVINADMPALRSPFNPTL